MTHDTVPSFLGEWCDLTSADEHGPAVGLYAEVNSAWELARPALPPSLLQALGKEEERSLAALIDRRMSPPGPTSAPQVLARLHRAFITEFDPARERESCGGDVTRMMSVQDDDDLLLALSDLTRSGYGSPLHLTARRVPGSPAQIVPAIHPSPIPPADFDERDRRAAYVRHMTAMVRHIGGDLCEEQVAAALELDRALWVAQIAEEPEASFPWQPFLERAAGTRDQPWTPGVGPVTRRRMAAWWSGTVQHRRDWILCRLAYDLGPFASEEALVQNSLFFAGRVLGLSRPRPRTARFVSFVKTVAPDVLADLYVKERGDQATLARARTLVEDLRREAITWTEATFGSGTGKHPCTQRMRGLVVELGHQSRVAAPQDSETVGSSVCELIMAARTGEIARRLAPIDEPACDADWKIQPFTAAAYYQVSANKVVIPWAVMREPLLAPDLPDTQVYALFGSLVAHEMAHALLPASPEHWDEFVERAALTDVMEQLDAHARATPDFTPKRSHRRELAVDAIGLLWASRALAARAVPATDTSAAPDPDFLRYWATRWRGTRPEGGAGLAHLDHHPPPELRCNVAAAYAGARPSSAPVHPFERSMR